MLFNNNYEDWGMQNARRMAHLLGVERRPPQTQLEIELKQKPPAKSSSHASATSAS